jgi:hypothetical protein
LWFPFALLGLIREKRNFGNAHKISFDIKHKTLSTSCIKMMMIKFATVLALALGAAAHQNAEKGLRGLTSANEKVANDNMGVDEFNYPEAVEVFAPSDLQDTENENKRDLTSYCYDFYDGAIRTSNHHNAKGYEGTHYHVYKHKSKSWCESYCSSYSWCKAYEYYHHDSRCELWKGWYGYYEYQDGFKSYVKKYC